LFSYLGIIRLKRLPQTYRMFKVNR
jgi:hypothetical protein